MSELVNGASRLFPIIGDPIRYVESPVWLTRTLQTRGVNAICFPLQVPADALDVVMTALTAAPNVDGILVTMPHKFAVFDYCATSSERASLFGVISVMRRNADGSWHGDMLDGLAFIKAQVNHGARIEGARTLLLGAGGAGSAIAAAALEAGVAELVVHDVDTARIDTLIETLRSVGGTRVHGGSADPTGYDLVFNATPMGMNDDDPLPLDATLLDSSMFVGDVVAGHGDTPLIRAAKAAGCGTATGGHMVEAVQELMADFMMDR